ncbi:MAG: virulence factor Mce family protein [Acidimicrobiales bacterium]|nr:virulence factor Mce family protein [Acidimicrobiales bacterium]
MRRLVALVAATACAAGVLASCSVVGGGNGGTYTVTAYFPRTISLYPSNDVRVLGLHAGHVRKVVGEGTRVRVVIAVNKGVPLPADVHATIVPLSLIGERYVQLFPVWTNGQPRAPAGTVINEDRTSVPVEPDEALAALKKFLDTLDPNATGRLVTNLADDLKGNGPALNGAVDHLSQLVSTIADKDQQLGHLIDQFDAFTGVLATREAQLGRVMDSFAKATRLLADERTAIEGMVQGLARFANGALDLVSTHRVQLDRDLTVLTRTLQSVRANITSVEQLLDSGPILAQGTLSAYSPQYHRLDLRTQFSPTVSQALQAAGLSLGGLVCLPIDVSCQPTNPVVPAAPIATAVAGGPAAPAGPLGPVPAVTVPPLAGPSPASTSTTNPLDAITGLLGGGGVGRPLGAVVPAPSTADHVAGGLAAVGRFLRSAARHLLGFA